MQIQDNVNAANLLSVAANIQNSGKTDNSEMGDFASFLNTSSANKTADRNYDNNNDSNYPDLSAGNKDRKIADDKINKKVNEKINKNTRSDDRQNKEKVTFDNNSVSGDSPKSVEVTDEEIEEVSEVIASIVNLLMDKLDVSADEIAGELDQLGMDVSNLLNEESIKEIFLNLESADVSQLLSDEVLNDDFTNLIDDFNDILEKAPVSVEQASMIIDDEEITIDSVIEKKDVQDISESDSELIPSEYEDDSVPSVEINDDRENNTGSLDSKQNNKKTSNKPEENANHFENPILQNISDSIGNVEDISSVVPNTRPADIVEQIIEQVRVNINETQTSMEMQLYPEHLGRIQINVVSKDGVMTARIAAETETARQAIEAGLNNLKESLENQNLKVDAIEVMVSTTAFTSSEERQDNYQQQGTGNREKRLNLSDLDEELTEEDEEIEKMRAANGSSVTYLA